MNQMLSSYQHTAVSSIANSRPETLMVMLYEGMISKVKQAIEKFDAGQVVQAREAIIRTMRIADALQENLNMENGGEVVKNLERLYDYLITELASANRADSPKSSLYNVLKVLEPLRDGFKQLEQKQP